AAGDADLFARTFGVVDDQHRPAALAGLDGRHQPGGTGPEHQNVIVRIGQSKRQTAPSVTLDVVGPETPVSPGAPSRRPSTSASPRRLVWPHSAYSTPPPKA